MKRKLRKITIFRFVVQVLFFFIVPGLFDLTFAGLKHIYLAVAGGTFNLSRLLPDILEALIIIPLTVLFGRFFCGWMCAFGAFNDFVYLVSGKLFKKRPKVPERIDSSLKYLKYAVLILIISLIWTAGNTSLSRMSPWAAFAQVSELPAAFYQYSAGFLVLLGILLGAMLVERFFCRYLCPLGAIFSLVSRVRPFKIEKNREKCGACRLCTNRCSMGIPLYTMDRVSTGECINCFKCIEACPRKNPQAVIFNERINSSLAGAVVIAAFTGIYSTGTMAVDANNTLLEAGMGMQASAADSQVLADSDPGQSTGIDTMQSGSDTAQAGSAAAQPSPDTAQAGSAAAQPSPSAPRAGSSKAAVLKPGSSSTASKSSHTPSASKSSHGSKSGPSSITVKAPAPTPAPAKRVPARKSIYNDGTYTGTGFGHRPGLQVSVTISADRITDVEILSSRETPRFSLYAFNTVPQEILQAQTANVSAVSGATETSDGIMAAVKDALSQART